MRHYPTLRPPVQEERTKTFLPRPFLKPRYQLFEINAIESDLASVAPPLVDVEEIVQLPPIVARKVLVETVIAANRNDYLFDGSLACCLSFSAWPVSRLRRQGRSRRFPPNCQSIAISTSRISGLQARLYWRLDAQSLA